MSYEPSSKQPICSKFIKEQMIVFQKKNHEKYLPYKGSSTETYNKNKSPSTYQSV